VAGAAAVDRVLPRRGILARKSLGSGLNMDGLRGFLEPSRTHFFLGKSGAGKSALRSLQERGGEARYNRMRASESAQRAVRARRREISKLQKERARRREGG
jgi:hypothetical protein